MEVFLRLLQLMFKILYIIAYPLWCFFLPRKGPSTIPPIRDRLLTLSVGEVLELYTQRKVFRKNISKNLKVMKIKNCLKSRLIAINNIFITLYRKYKFFLFFNNFFLLCTEKSEKLSKDNKELHFRFLSSAHRLTFYVFITYYLQGHLFYFAFAAILLLILPFITSLPSISKCCFFGFTLLFFSRLPE